MTRKKMGQPTKLTPDVQVKIVQALKAGNTMDTAATYAGIHRDTFRSWLKRATKEKARVADNPKARILKDEAPYVALYDAIEQAMAEAEVFHVTNIANAAKTDWKASAWILERRFGEKWQRKDQQTIMHSGQVEVNVENVRQKLMEKIKLIKAANE